MARFHHRCKARIFARDGNMCRLCFSTFDLDAHHIIPPSKGGTNEEDNGVTLCTKCHPFLKTSSIDWKLILSLAPGTLPPAPA